MFSSRIFWKIYLSFVLFIVLTGSFVGTFIVYEIWWEKFFHTGTLLYICVAAIAIGAALALAFGIFLVRRIVSPLRRMTEFIDSIAQGNYETRIPVDSSNKNEFGGLSNALNSMAEQIARDVSLGKAAEAALKESARYENLFRHANDAILIFEPENEIVLDVNDKACEIYGRRREDFVGRSLKEMSQNTSRGTKELDKLLHDGVYDEFESVHLRGDGTPINLIINAAVIEHESRPAILTINRDVTAKKQIEEDLRASEERFRSVARSAQDAIVSADNRGQIVFWNEGAEKIFGYSEPEVLGQSLQMIMPAQHRAAHQKGLERNVETGENRLVGKTVEVPGRRKDGTVFPLELSLGSWESAGEKFFTAVLRDITERKRISDELEKNVSTLTSTFEATADGILVVGADNRIVAFNEKFSEMWGMTTDELNSLDTADAPARIQNQIKKTSDYYEKTSRIDVRAGDSTFDVLELKDGRFFERYSQSQKIGDKITGRVFSFRNITRRRQAEEERDRFFKLSLDLLCTAGFDGYFKRINPAWTTALGYTEEELLARPFSEIIHPGDREATAKEVEKLFGGGFTESFEIRLVGKDGRVRWFVWSATPFASERVFYAVGKDITERKAAEESLLKEKNFTETVAASLPGVFYVFDENGRYLRWNENFERVTGYTPEEIRRIHPLDLFPDSDKSIVEQRIGGVLTKGEDTVEANFLAKDGTMTPYFFTGRRIALDGKVCIVGMGLDIAERRRAEDRLRRSEANLAAAQRIAHLGSWEIELSDLKRIKNNKVRWSDEVYRIFGHQPEQFDVNFDSFFEAVHPTDRKRVRRAFLEAVGHRKELNIEYRIVLPDNKAEERVHYGLGEVIYDEKTNQPLKFVGTLQDITTRQRAERETSKLAAIVASSSDAIISKNLDGTIQSWNRGAEELFGFTAAEACGRHISILFPPERLGEETVIIESILAGKLIEQFETVRVRRDGAQIPVSVTVSPIKNAAGETVGISKIARDITERKQTEESLQESEARYRRLFESNPNPIWVYDADTLEFLAVNEESVRHYGYTREEFSKLTIIEMRPPEDISLFKELSRQADAGVEKFYSVRHLKRDGTIIEVDIAAQNIAFEGRRARFALITDVTERKKAEKALQESEERFRSFMNNNPAVAFMKDEQGRYVFANETMERIFQLDAKDFLGKTDFDWLPESVARELRRNDEEILRSNDSVQILEKAPLPGDEELHSWLSFKFPVRDASGKKFLGGVAIDVTDRERAESALRASENKLRTLLDSMSEGLVQVSNDEVIEFVNDRFCEMTGYAPEELLGKITLDFIYDEAGRKFVREANRQRIKGEAGQYELNLRKKSGEMLYVIVGGAPILDAVGGVVGSMGVFTDITERKQAEEQLLHDAFHDGLTGLANRKLFMEHLQTRIERAKRSDAGEDSYAVLFLDFDGFKVINDSLGHGAGDKLLLKIARRLETSLRPGDVVARLGGDEFTILLSSLDGEEDALRVAERIQEIFKKPFKLAGRKVFTSASIGIALGATNGKGQRAEEMLRDADIAMYRAKSNGKAQHQVFDRQMHELAIKRLRLETEMRLAVEREEFCVFYQPIVEIETEKLVGFEALIRWRHPERGMIPPFEFIPVAEENNLILPIGKWILHESCRQLREWQDNFPAVASNLTVSVNLSCKEFSQLDLAEQIAETLEKTGLNPRFLKLEITESHVMETSETAVAMMNRLRSLGVQLSLDDFGTGYSSLSYLHRLPVNYLKIDRSFVTRMAESKENEEIVHTIIKLAQNLKMKTIAEGIETEEQLRHLRGLDCGFGQGYFFSKPLDAEHAKRLIEESVKNLMPLSALTVINVDANM